MPQKQFKSKALVFAVFSATIISLCACSQKIDGRQTEVNQGLIYKLNSNDPFTGKIMNYDPVKLGFMIHGSCNVNVVNGILDGNTSCISDSGNKISELTYKDGQQNGEVNIWDDSTLNLIVKFNVLNGRKNGTEEYFNSKTKTLVRQTNWLDDKKSGSEKIWDLTGQILLTNLNWNNGVQTGYSKSGEWENIYKDGNLEGIQHWYIVKEGEPQQEFVSQKALAQSYNAGYYAGLLGEGKYIIQNIKDGREVPAAEQDQIQAQKGNAPDSNCLDRKINAFHLEKGKTADISNDMIEEWRQLCDK